MGRSSILTVVVTINTSVWLLPSAVTLPPVAKSVSSPPEEPVVSPEPRTRARKRSKRHLWRLPVDHSPAALSRWSTTPDTKNRTREKNERRYHIYLAVSEITFPILLNPFRYSLLQR